MTVLFVSDEVEARSVDIETLNAWQNGHRLTEENQWSAYDQRRKRGRDLDRGAVYSVSSTAEQRAIIMLSFFLVSATACREDNEDRPSTPPLEYDRALTNAASSTPGEAPHSEQPTSEDRQTRSIQTKPATPHTSRPTSTSNLRRRSHITPTQPTPPTPKGPPTPFPPPLITLDTVLTELLASTDPALEARIEMARTIPMSALWEHESWQEHPGGYDRQISLQDGFQWDALRQTPEEVIAEHYLAPLAHLVVLSTNDPVFGPRPETRWSGCPSEVGSVGDRSVHVVVLDGDRGWTQAAIELCPDALPEILEELSAVHPAEIDLDGRFNASTRTPSQTPWGTHRLPKPTPTIEPSPANLEFVSTRPEDLSALSDETKATLVKIPFKPGAWWRYELIDRFTWGGELPIWKRAELHIVVDTGTVTDEGALKISLAESVRWHWGGSNGEELLGRWPSHWILDGLTASAIPDQSPSRSDDPLATPVAMFGTEFFPHFEGAGQYTWQAAPLSESIHTPAGEFDKCVAVTGQGTGIGIEQVFCEGIGLVRTTTGGGGMYTFSNWYELVDFDVSPAGLSE